MRAFVLFLVLLTFAEVIGVGAWNGAQASDDARIDSELRLAKVMLADQPSHDDVLRARNIIKLFVLNEDEETLRRNRDLILRDDTNEPLLSELDSAVRWHEALTLEGQPAYRREGEAFLERGPKARNFDVAASLFLNAARDGDGDAMYILSKAFLKTSDAKLRHAGEGFLCSAADSGNVAAQLDLSKIFSSRVGAHLAKERAFYWMVRASLNQNDEIPAEFGRLRRSLSNQELRNVLAWVAQRSPDIKLICG